jgi:hypothetical protein
MNADELRKHADWIQNTDIQNFLKSAEVPNPWFPAYRSIKSSENRTTWFSALIPVSEVPKCLQDSGWDLCLGDGKPSVWTHYEKGEVSDIVYCPFGNEEGIEPLVIWREFHGMREDFVELSQEFCLYHNLYHEPSRKRFIHINRDGDESEAARYDENVFEIRTDLLLRYCAAKQMALGVFVDSFRYSSFTLQELGLSETRTPISGDSFVYHLAFFPDDLLFKKECKTIGGLMGKKYILPLPMPTEDCNDNLEVYQEFIIDSDAQGRPIKHTCDPGKLANYFGANPDSPHYLTPVFFRTEVLSKYYADPQKYSVEDGYLRCGGLWGVRIDNDHTDYVAVWLGDLGRDVSEAERNYWLNFNIHPQGRKISKTNFKRAFLAEPTNPTKADLVFKYEYEQFGKEFNKAKGWNFFLPLHEDDEHFLTGLRLLSKDNQSEFDSQLIALTKLLVDSLNEKKITHGLTTLTENDKGITKLEKFFKEGGAAGYEPHVKFLRVLQDLRSKSAAHRKGSSYEQLIADLQMADEGQQRVFASLLISGSEFIRYLRALLIPKEGVN